MSSISTLTISRRFIQTSDVDSFNGIPQTSAAARNQPAPVFDSSMALTILVLLTALFFLAFFSIYIRRFSSATAAAPPQIRKCSGGGVAVDSLPLVPYGGAAKHRIIDECPICLGEFSEMETVKMIPYCRHVFHPSCIDTWLASHVTCPLCRSAELFGGVDEIRLDVDVDVAPDMISGSGIPGSGMRRACSCSDLTNRTALRRSASF